MTAQQPASNQELAKLLEKGAQAYAEKNYELSVELYSEACEHSNLLTGKDDPDLLFLYAKSLFGNAVSKSGVLGASASEQRAASDARSGQDNTDADDEDDKDNENGMFQFNETLAEEEEEESEGEESEKDQDDEDEDNEENEQTSQNQEAPEDEQTDFEVSWEILDLARALYEEKLQELGGTEAEKELTQPYMESEKQKLSEIKSPIVVIKKKLSDVYDLLGEISLETENFTQASQDLDTLVELRLELYPFHSCLISEAYYKLSLAMEFNVQDIGSIEKSIEAMKNALKSIHERFQQPGEKRDDDLLHEMELRLDDLQKGDAAIKEEKKKIMMGILGEAAPASEDSTPAQSAAVPAVNDLTSMVKKRKQKSGRIVNKKLKTSK